ncbi:histidine kinase N-terminal 7TM domain-containing protein [Halorientalis regularis]|uniref:histidine kinase n=1 Tax=Halorientalis regularis TaxID=660518 RepID=A0A1G7K2K0_9EURY|nr:histidine kinase N-terminal 7TM domain-containing protein [Halorientalis regularis]SDF31347.1 PAS domain S-box-containing protein [Halorientalis regularis]
MFPGPELYGALMMLAGLPAIYLIRLFWDHRGRPSGRWFVVTFTGMGGWAVFWGLMLLFDSYSLSTASFNLVLLFVNISVIGWFFIAVEYVWQKRVTARTVLPFLIIPSAIQILAWTNPIHMLMWGPETQVTPSGIFNPDYEIGFYIHAAHAYLLAIASIVLLSAVYVEREKLYRKQTLLLLLGGLIPIATSIVFFFRTVPRYYLNPTPLGFLVGTTIWGWGLFRYRLLEAMPIARRTVLNEMDEGILIVDDQKIVTDSNPALRQILGVARDPVGDRLRDVLAEYPSLFSQLEGEYVHDETVTVTVQGEDRHLTVNKFPVFQDDSSPGDVIVFNDQTELLQYEEELELLKEVFSRVLRHDIRNKLNVIRAHGELLSNCVDPKYRNHTETIVQTSDSIIDTAEKARVIGSLVETDRESYEIDLVQEVEATADWARQSFPDAEIELDTAPQAWVLADEAISLAIKSLIENAIVHSEKSTPRVRVSVSCHDDVRLEITDNGPGLTDQERQIFDGRPIDQLNHSTGLGLWLVKWVCLNSDADITVDSATSGTRVTIRLDRVRSRPRTMSRGA